MHEYYLFLSLLSQIEESLNNFINPKIKKIILRIGEYSGVEEAYLREVIETFKVKTPLENAEILFEKDPLKITCERCNLVAEVKTRACCPNCGSYEVKITGGLDVILKSIELEDEECP